MVTRPASRSSSRCEITQLDDRFFDAVDIAIVRHAWCPLWAFTGDRALSRERKPGAALAMIQQFLLGGNSVEGGD